ncbi:MAG: type II toxin-antitoxin system HicA family toxin [Candidatus Contendobacter sp.]|nr:type II toxin-antitoxin system HicA family toxin [Candidatus Contendobacter sp.]
MSKADKTLDKMRATPRDWRIEDLESVAKHHGLTVRKPGGSHVIFQKPGIALEVSVPAHKPIKPVYVRRLIELIDA